MATSRFSTDNCPLPPTLPSRIGTVFKDNPSKLWYNYLKKWFPLETYVRTDITILRANEANTLLYSHTHFVYILEKWFPLQGERAQSLKVFNVRTLDFKNKIEMRKRRQNNNRSINLTQANNILHILHVHHLTQNFISSAYTIFNTHEHWRKMTYDDWTLLIPLLLLFRLESLPFLST